MVSATVEVILLESKNRLCNYSFIISHL